MKVPKRLLVGVLGNRNSGKSHTWNNLFGRVVQRGKHPRQLELQPGKCVEVFLVSGSFEERDEYAGEILEDQNCRIVLCSMQYIDDVHDTLDYFIENDFFLYMQWLNPGYSDPGENWDRLGLVNKILSVQSAFALRDGRINASDRVQEMREFIYGWATYRNLIHDC